jgi:DNA-binding response OmpR family regulator
MTKTILIADDRSDARQLLEDILEQFAPRIRVLVAVNGEEALKLARAEKPDLAFLDVMMPIKSGFEVCREIKDDPDLVKVYVILVTALSQLQDREKGAVAGADEYVTKPYDTQLIAERIEAILGIKPL